MVPLTHSQGQSGWHLMEQNKCTEMRADLCWNLSFTVQECGMQIRGGFFCNLYAFLQYFQGFHAFWQVTGYSKTVGGEDRQIKAANDFSLKGDATFYSWFVTEGEKATLYTNLQLGHSLTFNFTLQGQEEHPNLTFEDSGFSQKHLLTCGNYKLEKVCCFHLFFCKVASL